LSLFCLTYAATTDCSLSASGTLITDEWFSHSARGEVTGVWEWTQHSGGYYRASASYWADGTLNVLSGPGLPTLYYGGSNGSGLDGEGRVQQVTASSGTSPLASGVVYNVASQPTAVTLGSGDSDGYGYDPNTGRQTNFQANVGGTNPLLSGTLGWNANGSLGTLALNYNGQAENCTYSHDDLSRVASVNCNSGSTWAQTFGYDAFGNVTKSGTGSWLPTYNQSTNRIQSIPGASVSYDANGNLLSDGAHSYTWDDNWGTPSAIDTVSLTYDALGRMVEQNRSGSYTQVVYSPSGAKLALMSGQTLTKAFVPLPGGGTAVYTGTGLAYYRHPDWLGSSRLATTPSRTVYGYTGYAPFGENYEGQGSTDLSFTGQNQDTVSGLDDFLYREYSPAQGRWTKPDPSGMKAVDTTNPQSWNRYAYVTNAPLANVDQDGLSACVYINQGEVTTLFDVPKEVCIGDYSVPAVYLANPLTAPLADAYQLYLLQVQVMQLTPEGVGKLGQIGVPEPLPPAQQGPAGPPKTAPPVAGGSPANNPTQPQQPKKSGCGLAVAQGAISVGLDVLGTIPGLGNMVSAGTAAARVVDGVVAYGGAAYGAATGLPDESPVGAVSAGTGLGLTLAGAALEGGKVIPVVGNVLSGLTGLYDGYQLAKTIQRCW
jgi:RHS repeat-associated protein